MAKQFIDASEVNKAFTGFRNDAGDAGMDWSEKAAWQLLELSKHQVPHRTGNLEKSGEVEPTTDGHVTFYNAPYAAYQHEGMRADGSRVIENYRNGRKGKYLEDPLRNNKDLFLEMAGAKLFNNMKR